jgi:drug/metabolite transporter (DMT)-like permease
LREQLATLTGLLGVVCWACVPLFVALSAPCSPVLVVGVGSLVSFAGFFIYELRSGTSGRGAWPGKAHVLLAGVAGNGIYRGLFWAAVLMVSPVEAVVLLYIFPVLVGAGGQLVREHHLCVRHLGAIVVTVAGLWMFFHGSADIETGHILALLAAMVWASYVVLAQCNPVYGGNTVTISYLVTGVLCISVWAGFDGALPAGPCWLFMMLAGGCGCGGYLLWDIGNNDGNGLLLARAALLLPLLSVLALVAGGFDIAGPELVAAAALIFVGGIMVSPLLGKRRAIPSKSETALIE